MNEYHDHIIDPTDNPSDLNSNTFQRRALTFMAFINAGKYQFTNTSHLKFVNYSFAYFLNFD